MKEPAWWLVYKKIFQLCFYLLVVLIILAPLVTLSLVFTNSDLIYTNARTSLDPWDDSLVLMGGIFIPVLWLISFSFLLMVPLKIVGRKALWVILIVSSLVYLTTFGVLLGIFRRGRGELLVELADNLAQVENDVVKRVEYYRIITGKLPDSLAEVGYPEGYTIMQYGDEKSVLYEKKDEEGYIIRYVEGWYWHAYHSDKSVWRMRND